ncbi:MAG TPA: hypothetical protein DHV55_09175, partial [Clostridiaceae bacterium]|nr:hypothetical protein [Clostridiaceae bacterium]
GIDERIKASRVRNSIACCMMGIYLLQSVFKKHGLELGTETGVTINELNQSIIDTAYEDLLSGYSSSRSVVDMTLERFNDMAAAGALINGVDYIVTKGTRLALNINRIYHSFLSYIREEGSISEYIPEKNYFITQLKHTKYFSDHRPVWFQKQQIKAYCLDIPAILNSGIDISAILGYATNCNSFEADEEEKVYRLY